MLESIAISGAAVTQKLKREMPLYPELQLPVKKFKLIDGGYSENLAAIPLIRRGIKNIIIVDSDEDPKYQLAPTTI